MNLIDAFKTRLPADRVHEHVNVFLKTPNAIYSGHIASASVLLIIAHYNPRIPVWFLFFWGFLELLAYPLLMELWRRSYLKREPDKRDPYLWIRLMDLLSFVVGTSWGVMTFVSLNTDDVAHFAVQMAISAGATAAAVRSLAVFPRSFALYATPYLGLLALRLVMLGHEFILLAILVLVFLAMMLRFGHDVLESMSQYIEISNENLDLAQRYREAAESSRHANREKTRLLAAASHDLRQPIHAIGLLIETLPSNAMDEKSKETLSRIKNSLQTLSKLFNSLLDVSLLDSGKIQVRQSVFDLEDALNHILDDYEPLAEIAHVTLSLECPKIGVVGDPILIRRMVQNLLSNAIRHSNGGTAFVKVQTDGAQVDILVSDDGPGIAKEHQALIFEEFTQIRQRSKREMLNTGDVVPIEKGLGLGLAIVRRLADLQNLTLHLETASTGTCLSIRGLVRAPLSEHAAKAANPSEKIGERFQQKRILVVDDDMETLEATVGLLQKWGCQLSRAANLAEVKNLSGPCDLIISDFSFPSGETGLEIIEEARKTHGSDLKAIIISADSSEQVQKQVKDAGLLLIHKPVQPVQLRSAMLDIFLSTHDQAEVIS
ncbi:hybrid sensor histidine kinase/response regulator [uncultured Cohaesibacter sp.]|uniref:ATP-binding response regulator n=1 Tax=uncultured Cohaesibacter sp. TaxID=1002546 RepID=UPI002931C073|nr:hybrid sensor histidine kinase/response regulator [uncultured Cohaesibacter sp.]